MDDTHLYKSLTKTGVLELLYPYIEDIVKKLEDKGTINEHESKHILYSKDQVKDVVDIVEKKKKIEDFMHILRAMNKKDIAELIEVASKDYSPVTLKRLLSEARVEMRLKDVEVKRLKEKIQLIIKENKLLENELNCMKETHKELEAEVPRVKSEISEMSKKMGQLEEEKTYLEKKVIFLEDQLSEADEEHSRQMEDQQKMYDNQLDRQMKEYDEQFSKNKKQHDKQLEELKKIHDEQLAAERNEIREQLAQQQKEQNELLKKFESSVQMNEKLLQQQQQEPASGEKDKCTIS